jgi:hypothetical protein
MLAIEVFGPKWTRTSINLWFSDHFKTNFR